MKEQLITYQTARLANLKGFNIPVVNFYNRGKKPYVTTGYEYQSERDAISNWNDGQGSYPTKAEDIECSAPTQSLLQKWLRDIHGIDLHILRNKPGYNEYKVEIYKVSSNRTHDYTHFWIKDGEFIKWFLTYEEALEAGLQESLKLI